jgi:hypothetical protein
MSYRVALLIAAASMLGFAGAARAESVTVTKAVQDACAWEYDKFCNQYGLGSELLDICFKQNARNMTKACVDALVAAATFRRNMSIGRRSCSAASSPNSPSPPAKAEVQPFLSRFATSRLWMDSGLRRMKIFKATAAARFL